ncbi:MAG: hypothetical protein OEW19_18675 [Acidobacteriota bacterium]|nr:hypothetical protein [Acidobacteriota bacterium]
MSTSVGGIEAAATRVAAAPAPAPWGMLDERAAHAILALVDRHRAQCLWFLRVDYYPQTPEEVERVLHLIEQHGDLDALRQVAAVRQWLSPSSSVTSAGS